MPRSANPRIRRSFASASAICCSISPDRSAMVVRSAWGSGTLDQRQHVALAHGLADHAAGLWRSERCGRR
jgi:hypothetical protein